MADFQSQAGPFQIRVLEGDLSVAQLQEGQPNGVLQLVGRALPFRGLEFQVTQRIKTTNYTGNPVATQQALGSKEEPTTISGAWKDYYLGDGVARALLETMRAICKRGLSVEVSWGGALAGQTESPVMAGEPIVRVGMISSVKARFTDAAQELAWEVRFEWRSDGAVALPVVAATSRLSPREELTAVLSEADTATAGWEAFRDGPIARLSGIPQAIDEKIGDAIEAATLASDHVSATSAAISESTSVVLRDAQSAISACQGIIESFDKATEALLELKPLTLAVYDDAVAFLRQRAATLDLIQGFFRAQDRAAEAAAAIAEHAEPDVLAEATAPAGTNLRDLAFRYYGNPDLWWAIAQFNGIQGSSVPTPASGATDVPLRTIRIPRPQAIAQIPQVC